MVTVVNKVIKTSGGDYTDLNAFFAAVPSNLVTADQQWVATFDGEVTVSAAQVCGAKTADATRNIVVNVTAGQGAAALNGGLFYDGTKGGALKSTQGGGNLLEIPVDFTKVTGLQCITTNVNSLGGIFLLAKTCSAIGNLIQLAGNTSSNSIHIGNNTGGDLPVAENNVIVRTGGAGKGIVVNFSTSGTVAGNTLYASPSSANQGIQCDSAGPVIKDNAIFGFATPVQGGNSSTTNNATDISSISSGSANLVSQSFASCFTSTTDLRVKTGSPLIGAGATVSGMTTDILGQTRASPPGIGAAEYTAPPAPAATIAWTEANDTVAASVVVSLTAGLSWTEANDSSTIAVTVGAASISMSVAWTEANDTVVIAAAVTVPKLVSDPIDNNTTAALQASLSGFTVTVLKHSDMSFVKSFTNQSTNASGVMTITDSIFVPGTVYVLVIRNTAGELACEKYTAS